VTQTRTCSRFGGSAVLMLCLPLFAGLPSPAPSGGEDGTSQVASRGQSVRVHLRWAGGESRIHPRLALPGMDFSAFRVAGGGALDSDSAAFRRDVAEHAAQALRQAMGTEIIVLSTEDGDAAANTVVHVTQSESPNGGGVGEGEYDPCDAQRDNEAIVFAESLRKRAASCDFSYENWVQVFANVAAHEVAHTLGYAHVERSDYQSWEGVVELMLDAHTIDELARPQRIITPQDTCTPWVIEKTLAANETDRE